MVGVEINTSSQVQINTNKAFHSQFSYLGQVMAVLSTNFPL